MASRDDDYEDIICLLGECDGESSSGEEYFPNYNGKGAGAYKVFVIAEVKLVNWKYYCKIGTTKQPMNAKLSELARGNPRDLEIKVVIPTNHAEALGNIVKGFFEEVRKDSAWYLIEKYEIDAIREAGDRSLNDGGVVDDLKLFETCLKYELEVARIKQGKKSPGGGKKRKI